MTSDDHRTEWLTYVARLNERNLNRHRNSGFTTWAVLAFGVYLLFGILEFIPKLHDSAEIVSWFLADATLVADLALSLGLFPASLLIQVTTYDIPRVSSRTTREARPAVYIMLAVFVVALLCLNSYMLFFQNVHNPKWPYAIVDVFVLFQAIGPIFTQGIGGSRKKERRPQLETDFRLWQNKRVAIIVLVGLSTFLLTITIVPLVEILRQDGFYRNIEALKTSLRVLGMLFAFAYVTFRIASFSTSGFLERLERRIVMEKLDPDQIKSLFVLEYLGQPVRDWTSDLMKQFDEKVEEIVKQISQAIPEIEDLKKINPDYKFEIEGRLNNIYKPIKEQTEKFSEFCAKSLDALAHIISLKGFGDDPSLVQLLTKEWRLKIERVDKEIDNLGYHAKALGISAGNEPERLDITNR